MPDKIENVQHGLICCSLQHSCNGCPYMIGGCRGQLHREAIEVIDALKAELDKCIDTMVKDSIDVIAAQKELLNRKPKVPCDYIVLHSADGGHAILVRKDKIIYAYDGKSGDATNIRLSGEGGFDCLLLVKETEDDILNLLKGEENENL